MKNYQSNSASDTICGENLRARKNFPVLPSTIQSRVVGRDVMENLDMSLYKNNGTFPTVCPSGEERVPGRDGLPWAKERTERSGMRRLMVGKSIEVWFVTARWRQVLRKNATPVDTIAIVNSVTNRARKGSKTNNWIYRPIRENDDSEKKLFG